MAQPTNVTHTTITATGTVTIPALAASARVVVLAWGGATTVVRFSTSGGTLLTKRAASLNTLEVTAHDGTAAGGETAVHVTLNGPAHVHIAVYEYASTELGAFLTGAAPNSTAPAADGRITPGTLAPGQAAVIFGVFARPASSEVPAERHWGFEPVPGRAERFGYEGGPAVAGNRYWWLQGVAAVAAGSWPVRSSATAGGGQSGAWAYADSNTASSTYLVEANPVVRENARPGGLRTQWLGATVNANIAGYTDKTSYSPGDTVAMRVDSNNVGFNAEIWRLGGYGYTTFGARPVVTVAGTPAVQPAPAVGALGAVTAAAWSTTASWAVPSDAVPGIYMINFRRTDNTAFVAQHLFIIRPTTPATKQANRIGLRVPDYTWQAYNLWGARSDAGGTVGGYTGRSLYSGNGVTGLTNRAYAVSFDRPYGTSAQQGNTWLFDGEMALVHFLEQCGYWVDYYSSTDLDIDPTIPSKYGVFISNGHDEYLTDNVRGAYSDARDAGTHLVVLGGNFALWRVRFDAGDTTRRTMICYKDTHDTVGYDGTTRVDPAGYTGTWRARNLGALTRVAPSTTNASDGTPYTLANVHTFAVDGTVTGIRVLIPSTLPTGPVVGVLYQHLTEATGTELARATFVSPVAGQFNTVDFTTPVAVTAGTRYIAAYYTTERFAAASNVLATTGRTLGHITSPATGAGGVANGRYHAGGAGPTYPESTNGTGTVYYAEPVFVPDPGEAEPGPGTGYNPDRRPESDLSAQWFVGNAPQSSAVQVPDTYAGLPVWRNTAVAALSGGSTYTSTVAKIGDEWDYHKTDEPTTPTNLAVLAHRDIALSGQAASLDGESYSGSGTFRWAMVLYRARSGALVFATGAWRWTWGLSRFRGGTFDAAGAVDPALQQATVNVLGDMGVQPATLLDVVRNNDATTLVASGPAARPEDYGLQVPGGELAERSASRSRDRYRTRI